MLILALQPPGNDNIGMIFFEVAIFFFNGSRLDVPGNYSENLIFNQKITNLNNSLNYACPFRIFVSLLIQSRPYTPFFFIYSRLFEIPGNP